MKLTAPKPEEAGEYYFGYINRAVKRGDVLAALPKQINEVKDALGGLNNEQALYKNGPAEWSIKEVLGHLVDTERVFSYRLLCISRNDKAPLPGFEQDDYVREAGFDNRPLKDLLQEFELVRQANTIAINHLTDDALDYLGTASGHPTSTRALIYMMVGHVDHHMESLQEKYLPNV